MKVRDITHSVVTWVSKAGRRLKSVVSPYLMWMIAGAVLIIGVGVLSWIVSRLDNWTEAKFTSPEDLSAAIRNVGLVVAALISVPFVVWRTSVAQKQANTATESLFNDKFNAASADLHAMRQISKRKKGKWETLWEADVTRRNAAIDRLEGLVRERLEVATRVARLLSVYVRELSREYPAKVPPKDLDPKGLRAWAAKPESARSDFQTAVSTLGRLRGLNPRVDLDDDAIDLHRANLQGLDLRELDLRDTRLLAAQLQGANLHRAQLQGADLRGAQLQGANLRGAQLQGAYLHRAQLQGADLLGAQLQGAYLQRAQLQGAYLHRAQLQGAYLQRTQLQGTHLQRAQLQGAYLHRAQFDQSTDLTATPLRGVAVRSVDLFAVRISQTQIGSTFGDTSVTLPEGTQPPGHWPDEELEYHEFEAAWRKWQRSIGFDPNDPSTWDSPKDATV